MWLRPWRLLLRLRRCEPENADEECLEDNQRAPGTSRIVRARPSAIIPPSVEFAPFDLPDPAGPCRARTRTLLTRECEASLVLPNARVAREAVVDARYAKAGHELLGVSVDRRRACADNLRCPGVFAEVRNG